MGYPTTMPSQQTPFSQQPPMQQAFGMQQQPAYDMPMQGTPAVLSVPLTLGKQGGRFLFPDGYSLELNGRITREEFSAIVAELNATAREYGPNMDGSRYVLAMLPCTGICTLMTWKAQFDTLKGELQRTCVSINARNAAKGISRVNLLYREVPYGGGYSGHSDYGHHGHCRSGGMIAQVEIQVLG